MIEGILRFYRRTLRLTIVQTLFFVTLLLTLNLVTLFFGAVMLLDWHWHYQHTLLVCLLQWVSVLVGLGIFMLVYQARIEKARQKEWQVDVSSLLYKGAFKVVRFLLNHLRKSSEK